MLVPQGDNWDVYQWWLWNTDSVIGNINNEDKERGRKVPGNIK